MTRSALAALALGGILHILLPGTACSSEPRQDPSAPSGLIDRYRQTLATDQGNLTLHYLLGVALLQDNQNAAALVELQAAYPAYQDSAEAHYNLAVAALRLDDLGSAEIYLDQALELGAGDMPAIFPVANLYFNMALKSQELGDANEAIRYFHKVLALDPEHFEVYRQLGDLHAQRNDIQLAIKAFRTYLGRFPDDPVSRDYLFALEFNSAQDQLAGNNLVVAARGFSQALEIQPDNPAALYYLGYIAYVEQQPGRASSLLQRALTNADAPLQETIRPLLYNAALALRKAGQTRAALEAIAGLADRQWAQFEELFLAGTLNLDLKNHRAAQAYLERAGALQPADPGARRNLLAAELGAFDEWLQLAEGKLREDSLAEAAAALQRAADLQPQDNRVAALRSRLAAARERAAEAHFSRSRAAIDAGDFRTATEQLQAGLAVQPDHKAGASLRDGINRALASELDRQLAEAARATESGAWDNAEEIYRRVLAIAPRHPEALAGLDRNTQARQQQVMSLLTGAQQALDAGQADQAINLFDQALAMRPDLEPAVAGKEAARQLKLNREDEYLLNGRRALEHSLFREARDWFDKALAVDNSPRVKVELAALQQKTAAEAAELGRQAEQAVNSGKFRQAEQLYARALALMPDQQAAIQGRAALQNRVDEVIRSRLLEAGAAQAKADYAAAMAVYRSILEIAPDNGPALDGLKTSRDRESGALNDLVRQGEQALAAGNLQGAEQLLTRALRQDAYHKDAQRLRQRLEEIRQSGAQPGDEQRLYLQGVAYYTQGQYAEAIKTWETVLLLQPGHEKSAANIAKTRRKLRQIQEYSGG